ncbi:hydantoinase/oxoprolinase family protein [Arenibacterium halophilum]|uniref:Hydantoinase/oxoprolinase family protein n=1 Tax=Arenibacterium halophilum TaxID=2583821 RepID=A0ABY2XGJ3_9RHOB|nr:hydantoinase/oxoprolinase family protein [Arenibacterium halophilum]TMV15510.1 hydantoinase/oxoprolinase family protein [Arenibacterium halophilum]
MTDKSTVIGVDVGGTFTDLFFLNDSTGAIDVVKVPSTRGREADGFLDGLSRNQTDLAKVGTIVHGTTVGTNALLERKGAKCGLITSAGFRDVLEMRRRDRPATWGLRGEYTPVIPRDMRLEVPERILADGTIDTPLDHDALRAAAQALLDQGAEAVVVAFVNAYANTAHEEEALKVLAEVWPNEHLTAATRLLPEIREFERTSTAALNGYLQPVVATYLDKLNNRLKDEGFDGDLLIVQSNGGVMTVDTAGKLPVRTALSGPAAGVIASAEIAAAAGFPNVITCDMGGTSFDVSLIAGGETHLAAQTAIDFGMVVRSPMIEISTIGAGGGSIAWVDDAGILQIGPESAGSIPGPVAYGQGNTRPTVTDANVVLGRINAERPIGGKLARLDVDAARDAILEHVGKPLGLDATAAAAAILRVANARLAGALRLVSIERGYDPRDFSALPFGGGGALHAGALIGEVGLKSALVPRYPGVASALGCVIADMRHDQIRTVNGVLSSLDAPALAAQANDMAETGLALLNRGGITFVARDVLVELDMSYLGQTHTVSVPVALNDLGAREAIRSAFEAAYDTAFGSHLDNVDIRVLNLRVAAIGRRPKFDLRVLAPVTTGPASAARQGSRQMFAEGNWHETPVYDRLALPVGAVIDGPAILEQLDTTIIVEPGQSARVDDFGNAIIEPVQHM